MITWTGRTQEKHLSASAKVYLMIGALFFLDGLSGIFSFRIESILLNFIIAAMLVYLIYHVVGNKVDEMRILNKSDSYTDEYLVSIQQKANSNALKTVTLSLLTIWAIDAWTLVNLPAIGVLVKASLGLLMLSYGSTICWQLHLAAKEENAKEDAYE